MKSRQESKDGVSEQAPQQQVLDSKHAAHHTQPEAAAAAAAVAAAAAAAAHVIQKLAEISAEQVPKSAHSTTFIGDES
jgi:hypothetical protein